MKIFLRIFYAASLVFMLFQLQSFRDMINYLITSFGLIAWFISFKKGDNT